MRAVTRVRQEERQSMWRLSSGPGGGDEAPELFDKEEEEERDKDQVQPPYAARSIDQHTCTALASESLHS